MNYQIIPLGHSLIPQIDYIYGKSFSKKKRISSVRKSEFWSLYIEKSYPYSMGIVFDNKLIGFSIAHNLKDVFWLGPIGILPPYQGLHLGKSLLAKQIEKISDTTENIFLESLPVPNNLGFYIKNQFKLYDQNTKIIINLNKTPLPAQKYQITEISPNEITADQDLKKFTDQIGITFQDEIKIYQQRQFGRFYKIYNQDVVSFIMLHQDRSETSTNQLYNCKFFYVNTDKISQVKDILCSLKKVSRDTQNCLLTLSLSKKALSLINYFELDCCKIIKFDFLMRYHRSNFNLFDEHFFSFSMSG